LDTLERRRDRHKYDSNSDSDRHYDRLRYHPYNRSDRGYLSNEFKKENPPTFDGKVKRSQDAEAWLLGMKNLFKLHDYSENMKVRVVTFSIRGKADI